MMRRLLIAAAALALAGAPMLLRAADTPSSHDVSQQALDLFGKAMAIVKADYVEPVTDEKLIEGALSGMLNGLDPHSSYLDKAAYDEMKVQTRGEYGGLGMEVTEENNMLKVISPIDDTPAAKAGIKPGDVITKIDGEPTTDFTLSDAVAKLRGTVGTSVVVTILRQGREPFDVTLERADIKIKSVKSRLARGNVGYIRISSFVEDTDRDLRAAVDQLQKDSGNKLIGYVLDLRNDPGGLVDQAVAVCDDLLDKGDIVSIRGRQPDEVKRYSAKPGDITKGLPIVVLINGGSASASEIVAGALRDDHRAILLGTKSFGKGSVQTIIPLQGHGALRLTTARYYTPSGRSIQAEGIVPDIEVEPARIEKVAEAGTVHEADLRNALKNPDQTAAAGAAPGAAAPPVQPVPPANVPPGTKPSATPKPELEASTIGTPADYQLARAVDLLEGVSIMHASAEN
ncbi:MAG TPA: S41 family peptidase [Stellaceae bacterium]|nr:S41 family peptidase [Stellaceae bacterium]